MHHFCRIGMTGRIGRFQVATEEQFARGDRVVCRTTLGVQLGEVLAIADVTADQADGTILRRCAEEDSLLWRHLSREAEKTLDDCRKWMTAQGAADTLLEIEPLLDGRTLYFHFLGEPPADFTEWSQEIVDRYEERIRASRFFQMLEQGCGPGCGSDAKGGCGSKSQGSSGGCAVCVAASACHSRKLQSATDSTEQHSPRRSVGGE